MAEGETVGGFERSAFSMSRIASERVAPAARAYKEKGRGRANATGS